MWQHKNVLNNVFEIFLIHEHYDVLYEDYDLYMYQISWSLSRHLFGDTCSAVEITFLQPWPFVKYSYIYEFS